MQEPYVQGVAIQDGPESCVGVREDVGEALTGVRMGRVLSREIRLVRGADAVIRSGRRYDRRHQRKAPIDPARSETPRTCGIFLRENREIPWCGGTYREGRKAVRR